MTRLIAFVQLRMFTQAWNALGLSDEQLREIELAIMRDPLAPPVMSGTGGLRKIRLAMGHSGKSGGARVCFASFVQHGVVYLCAVFAKNEKPSLSAAEKKTFRETLAAFETFLNDARHRGMTP